MIKDIQFNILILTLNNNISLILNDIIINNYNYYLNSITMSEIFQIDEVVIDILLQCDMNTLQTLYLTSKIFNNNLNSTFIINKLQLKFDFKKHIINNFIELIAFYNFKIEAPEFGQVNPNRSIFGIVYRQLPDELRWNKEPWLNRINKVQNSNLVEKFFDSVDEDDNLFYSDLINTISWTDKYSRDVEQNLRTPSKKLYEFINYSYLQLKNADIQ